MKLAYSAYYAIKGSDKELPFTALERFSEAIAQEGKKDKEKILKGLRGREKQRDKARKLRNLRGKLFGGSTTMVTITDKNGNKVDIRTKPTSNKLY